MFANLNKLKTIETNTNAIREGNSLYLQPRGFFVLNIMDLAKYLSKMVRIVKPYSIIKLELVDILNTYIVFSECIYKVVKFCHSTNNFKVMNMP